MTRFTVPQNPVEYFDPRFRPFTLGIRHREVVSTERSERRGRKAKDYGIGTAGQKEELARKGLAVDVNDKEEGSTLKRGGREGCQRRKDKGREGESQARSLPGWDRVGQMVVGVLGVEGHW